VRGVSHSLRENVSKESAANVRDTRKTDASSQYFCPSFRVFRNIRPRCTGRILLAFQHDRLEESIVDRMTEGDRDACFGLTTFRAILQRMDANKPRVVFPLVRDGHDPIHMDTERYMMVYVRSDAKKRFADPRRLYAFPGSDAVSVLRVVFDRSARGVVKPHGRRPSPPFFVDRQAGITQCGRVEGGPSPPRRSRSTALRPEASQHPRLRAGHTTRDSSNISNFSNICREPTAIRIDLRQSTP
jgi:hypothetical protein